MRLRCHLVLNVFILGINVFINVNMMNISCVKFIAWRSPFEQGCRGRGDYRQESVAFLVWDAVQTQSSPIHTSALTHFVQSQLIVMRRGCTGVYTSPHYSLLELAR